MDRKVKISVGYQEILSFLFFCTIVLNNVFGSDAKLYILSKLAMLLFFGASILYLCKRQKISISSMILVVTIFTLWELLSIIWSTNKDIALFQLKTQLQLFVLFLFSYIYVREFKGVDIFLKATYVSGVVLSIYSMAVYGVNGFIYMLSQGDRMGGEISNENTFGMVFSFAVIASYYYFLRNKKKIFFLSIFLFSFFALSSGSKKALLIIGIGIAGISCFYYGIKKIWKIALVCIVVGITIIFALRLNIFATINERITSFLSGEFDVSDQIRMNLIETGKSLIWEKPLIGYGLGHFKYISGYSVYSHNNFIELAVSLGIIGFVIYYIPFVYSLFKLLKDLKNKNIKSMFMFVLVMLNFVLGYGAVQFYEKDIWILLGVTLAYVDDLRRQNKIMKGEI